MGAGGKVRQTAPGAPVTTTDASNLLNDINAMKPPACNDAALRVLGLSFAGWNGAGERCLAFACMRGAFTGRTQ